MTPETPDLFEGWRRRRPRRKVRVLYVIRRGRGRAAQSLRLLLRYLDREAFEPAVAASPLENPSFPDELARLGVPVHPLDIHPVFRPVEDVRAVQRVMEVLRGGRFDVMHACGVRAALLSRAAARVSGTHAVVYTPHGFLFQHGLSVRGRRFRTHVEHMLGHITDAMICASRTEADEAVHMRLIDEKRIHVIPDAIDMKDLPGRVSGAKLRRELGVAPASRLIVMTATLRAPRDPGTLLRAARHVLKVQPNTHFVLVGDGEMAGYCRDLARHLEIGSKVLCTGYREDARAIMRTAAACVHSARAGGPTLSLLESMALATPVIASDIPGCREVITHGKTGVLFPAGDERILAGAILKVTGDRDLSRRLGRAARDYVRRTHAPGPCTRAVENVYLQTLADPAKNR